MNDLFNQQAAKIAEVIQQQADQAEATMTAAGIQLVEKLAAEAMNKAAVNAAGSMAIRAQELLSEMAGDAGDSILEVQDHQPDLIEPARVIDLQPVPISLPGSTMASLPQSIRMLNAAPASGPSKASKRRARRKAQTDSE